MSYKKDYLIIVKAFNSDNQKLIRVGRKSEKYINAFVDGIKSIMPLNTIINIETYG